MSGKELQTEPTDAVRLERIEPERNAYRFYCAVLWPDLFGGVALVREWGRIGQGGTVRRDPYADLPAARQALRELIRRKCRRGYRVIS